MHGEVLSTEALTPHLVRVVLGGPGLDGFAEPGGADSYVNAFFLPPGAGYTAPFDDAEVRELPWERRPFPRRITVRAWDAATRRLTLDIVTHGDVGYAGRWALHARPGDALQFRGPAGAWSPDPDADWHLLVGDASALPAIAGAAERVPAGVRVVAVIEVAGPAEELALDSPGDLAVTWVHTGTPYDADQLARTVAGLDLPAGRCCAFVHGEAEATRVVRRHLLSTGIVAREDLSCSPYWRHPDTDEEWRAVKAAWTRQLENDVD